MAHRGVRPVCPAQWWVLCGDPPLQGGIKLRDFGSTARMDLVEIVHTLRQVVCVKG